MTKNSVLILDNYPQTLAVVRSLGAAGFNVVLGYNRRGSEASYSRYCHESWAHPAMDEVQSFENSLCRLLDDRPDIQRIFAVAETSVNLILQMPGILSRNIRITMVPRSLFNACVDKQQANCLAASANISFPKTRVVANLQDLTEAATSIGFPVIVKSVCTAARVFGRKAYVIKSREHFDAVFMAWPKEHDDLMIQEFIDGMLEAADFVAQNGTLLAYHQGCSQRTDLLDGTGFGVEFRSLPPSPDVLAATRSFVKTHDYSGPGIIQFMRESGTGKIYFLENNPRLSAGIADVVTCGQDFPLLSLQAFEDENKHKMREWSSAGDPYSVGHYAYWFSRDFSGYLNQRKSLSRKERREWLRNILRSIKRADSHIMWQLHDPLPGIRILAGLAARYMGRFFSR